MANYYTIQHTDVNGISWKALIEDALTTPTTEVVLKPATSSPITIKTINNGDDKLTTIRAKECALQFINEGFAGLELFAGADVPDDKWRVTITRATQAVFIGFLSVDDLSEPLQDPGTIVQLTATCGLGKLKEVELKDFIGYRPIGVHKLVSYLAMALMGTGLALGLSCCDRTFLAGDLAETYTIEVLNAAKDIIAIPGNHTAKIAVGQPLLILEGTVINTLMISSFSFDGVNTNIESETQHLVPGTQTVGILWPTLPPGETIAFDKVGIDAKTFVADLNEMESCYTVLEKILSPMYFLTQQGGRWWIVNHCELSAAHFLVKEYTSNGVVGMTYPKSKEVLVGRLQQAFFTGALAEASLVRPVRMAKTKYTYSGQENNLANEDYNQGVYIGTEINNRPTYIPGSDKVLAYDTIRKYHLDGWTLKRVNITTGATSAPNTDTWIRRYFAEGVEKFREIVVGEPPAGDKGDYYLENNNAVPVERGDRVRLTYEWRAESLYGGQGQLCHVLLYGDSGKVYTLRGGATVGNDKNKWYDNPNTANPAHPWSFPYGATSPLVLGGWVIIKSDYYGRDDGGGAFSDPIPEDGTIIVRLFHFTRLSASTLFKSLFQNIQFEVKQYIGVNVLQATGQYAKVSQDKNYASTREIDVFIDNSPKRSYKGTLLRPDGTINTGYAYDISGPFVNSDALPGVVGNWSTLAAYSMWRQLSKVYRTIRGQVGFSGVFEPDMIASYTIEPGSNNPHVQNKVFELLSYEWDCANCKIGNVVLAELPQGGFGGEKFESGYTND